MFILRAIFWIAVLAFLLPTGEGSAPTRAGHGFSAAQNEDYRPLPAAYRPGEDAYGPGGDAYGYETVSNGTDGSYASTPIDPASDMPIATGDKLAHALQLARATGQAIGDLMEFCDRNPQVCETAMATAYFVRAQAEHYGLKGLELIGAAVNEGVDDPDVIWRRVQTAEGPVPLPRPQRY